MVQVNFGDAASPLVSGTTVNWPQTMTAAAGGQLGALLGSVRTPTSGQIASPTSNAARHDRQPADQLGQLAAALERVLQRVNVLARSPSVGDRGELDPDELHRSDPSGNDLAIQISQLSRRRKPTSPTTTFVSKVGSDTAAAQGTQTNAQASSLLQAIDGQRQSVSGVSLDEEMTNLITYQRSYQASARVMNAIDTTLDTLINQVGAAAIDVRHASPPR